MPRDPRPEPSRPRKPRRMSPEREMPKRITKRKRGQSVGDKAENALKNLLGGAAAGAKAGGKAIRKVAIGDLGQPKKTARPVKRFASMGDAADYMRKTKQAQAIGREKVAMKKQAAVQSKRETGKAIKAATKKKIDNKRKTGYYEKPKGK